MHPRGRPAPAPAPPPIILKGQPLTSRLMSTMHNPEGEDCPSTRHNLNGAPPPPHLQADEHHAVGRDNAAGQGEEAALRLLLRNQVLLQCAGGGRTSGEMGRSNSALPYPVQPGSSAVCRGDGGKRAAAWQCGDGIRG